MDRRKNDYIKRVGELLRFVIAVIYGLMFAYGF